jgi:glycerate kinase
MLETLVVRESTSSQSMHISVGKTRGVRVTTARGLARSGRVAVADHASVSGASNVRTTLTRPARIVRISIPRATG